MEKLNVWARKVKQDIEIQKDKLYKRDYKFFKIDRLERMTERIDTYSIDCEHCNNLKTEVEDITEKLADYVTGSPRERGIYEKRTEAIVSHLKKSHGLVQESYFASIYTLFGLLAGLAVSIGLSFLLVDGLEFYKIGRMLFDTKNEFPGSDVIRYVFLGAFIPLTLAGRTWGAAVDRKKRKADLIL